MRKLRYMAVALALGGACTASAQTWNNDKFTSGNWTGGAYDGGTGQFSHCGIYTGYQSGIDIHFAIDREYTWRIGFVSKDFNLTKGQKVDLVYFIDKYQPHYGTATAINQQMAVLELEAKSTVFDQFRKGTMLNVMAAGRSYRFRLDGTNAALTAALDCVARNLRVAAPSNSTRPQSAYRPTAEQSIEAVKFMANVIAGAGFQGYRLLTAAELAEKNVPGELREATVSWVGPKTLGTLHIIPKELLTSVDDAMPYIISNDSKFCQGNFGSGSVGSENSATVRRFFTACSPGAGDPYSIYYTITRVRDGSYYKIATVAFGDPEPARVADEGIRDAALQAAPRR